MQPTKSRSATRLIWRMTAENQFGEILELPTESRAGRNSQGAQSRCTQEPASRGSTAMGSASLVTWRASSYDLLQGLTVRDVSEKIPQRTFEVLFSADAASCKRR